MKWRLPILVAVLIGVIVYGWVTDHRGPAFPDGSFLEALRGMAMLLAVFGVIAWSWAVIRDLLKK